MTTESQDKPKKKPTAGDYMPFWKPLFETIFENTGQVPPFYAKLCYPGREFSLDGSTGPCVRFYPSELNAGKDLYFELHNWTADHYEEGYRVLYRLPYNPAWISDHKNFMEITTDSKGLPLASPVYSVNFKHFEMVNRTSVKSLAPVLTTEVPQAAVDAMHDEAPAQHSLFEQQPPQIPPPPFDATTISEESTFTEEYVESDDSHYTSMTIRDIYCIVQNKPLSNKKWLNTLIKQGEKINLNTK